MISTSLNFEVRQATLLAQLRSLVPCPRGIKRGNHTTLHSLRQWLCANHFMQNILRNEKGPIYRFKFFLGGKQIKGWCNMCWILVPKKNKKTGPTSLQSVQLRPWHIEEVAVGTAKRGQKSQPQHRFERFPSWEICCLPPTRHRAAFIKTSGQSNSVPELRLLLRKMRLCRISFGKCFFQLASVVDLNQIISNPWLCYVTKRKKTGGTWSQ